MIAAQHGCVLAERHDDVVPCRVWGLLHISDRRVGIGVGMAVHHPLNLEAGRLAGPIDTEEVPAVDRVDPARGGGVAAGVKCRHAVRAGGTGEEATGFVG